MPACECLLTHVITAPSAPRSTADARRPLVVARAVAVFAQLGYYATPVTAVADAAGISQAYVFRLFGDKLGLFVAALDHCYERVVAAMRAGADRARGGTPADVLAAMGDAYADLLADRDLVMLQVHAQSAATVPEIRAALHRGYAVLVAFVQERSGAADHEVQQFIAYGQLCHLIATANLDAVDTPWARLITAGMRHPAPARA